MGFFGKFWQLIRGFFIQAGDDMVSSSPGAIRATYASAIKDAKGQYDDMRKAVALLASERDKTEQRLKQLDEEEKDLQRKLEGTLALAEQDPSNPAHREAGTRYLARMKEIDLKQAELEQDLENQEKRVEDYKVKLRTFKTEIERLKREEGEMVAEFISNQQVIQLEERLQGLGESAVDESLVAIREKVNRMKSEAKIATEMGQSTAESQDAEYERVGAQMAAESKFDELLKARGETKAGVAEKERDLG